MERLRKRPTEMTLRAARTFFAKHAPILKFEKAHFADQKDGRRWFLLCLDKRMLPLMREASRIGTAEQKAARIEDFRAHLERYRTRMSADERAQLNAAFATSEGQRLAKDAIHFFCGELSASDKTSLAPVIQEVVAILHAAGASASPAEDP